MIHHLLTAVDPDAAGPLRWNLVGLAFEGILLSVGFALLVPLLRSVFNADYGAAWAG